jgi:hypothetical protein
MEPNPIITIGPSIFPCTGQSAIFSLSFAVQVPEI